MFEMPSAVTTTTAVTTSGIASTASMMRLSALSTHLPK